MRRSARLGAAVLLGILAGVNVAGGGPPTAAARPTNPDAIVTDGDRRGSPVEVAPRGTGRLPQTGQPADRSPTAPRVAASPSTRTWTVDRLVVEPLPNSAWLTVEGVGDYRGRIVVGPTPSGLAVIDELSVEQYLLGLAEVPSSWPAEAQRAQAIAARTYALYETTNPAVTSARAAGADLCATDACQVFVGMAKERGPNGAAWRAAVQATSGQVLLHQGRPLLAKYSSSNGGRSVPGGRPYLQAVDDPDDAYSPYNRWRVAIALAEVASTFSLPALPDQVTRVGDVVELGFPQPGGGRGNKSVPATEFRLRLNELPAPEGLPRVAPSVRYSASIDLSAGVAILEGRGWGHGIGMSQYGALGKAVRGLKAADILAAYYGGIRPTKLPADPPPIKVAVALDAAQAVVTGPGRFRLLDGSGAPLAVAGEGRWTATPAPGGKVLVSAPAGLPNTPAIGAPTIEPATPVAGMRSRLSFRLDSPAIVRVVVSGPGSEAVPVTKPTLVAGEGQAEIPALPAAGQWTVVIEADAGGGRVASVPLAVTVLPPDGRAAAALASAAGTPPSGGGGSDRWPAALAAAALLAVTAFAGRQFRGLRLH